MPQVTVYVREEDIEKWKSLKKKTQFLHNALHDTPTKIKVDGIYENQKLVKSFDGPCKHGADPRMCKHAKVQKNGERICR